MTRLPLEIEGYLSRFVVRRRLQRAIRALGRAALFTLIWMTLWCLLDRLIDLPAMVRSVGLISNIACVMAIITRPLLALAGGVDIAGAALAVERRQPRFRQRLATVTSRALGPGDYLGSPELFGALTQEVSRLAREEDPTALLPWSKALREWVLFAVSFLLLIPLMRLSWLDAPTLVGRYVMPLAQIQAVTTTRLTVAPGDLALPAGDALRISVRARHLDASAPPPVLHVRSVGGAWFDQPMAPTEGKGFTARIAHVARDLEYFITAGDATSGRFDVTVLAKPGVASFNVHYDYPPYTRLPPKDDQITDGTIEGPVGTEVTLSVLATQPLRLASMTMGQQTSRLSESGDPARWQARFSIQKDDHFTIRMAGQRGASAAFRGGTIRAISDHPPVAVLPDSGADSGGKGFNLAADARVPVRYQAADDYPLARLDLEVNIRSDAGDRRISFALDGGDARQALGAWALEPRALGAHKGDRIEVRLRAEDQAGQFDLSAPRRWKIVAPTGARPPGGEIASSSGAATRPAPGDAPVPLDPPGYARALEAYFQSLRARNQDR